MTVSASARLYVPGTLSLVFNDTSYREVAFTNVIPTAVWNMPLTIIGVFRSGWQALYINGVLVGSQTNAIASFTNGTPHLVVGSLDVNPERYGNVFVDNVCIWNRALTAADVAQIAIDPYLLFRRPVVIRAPASGVTVTPDPATAAASTVAPTVVLDSLTLAPSPAEAKAATIDPLTICGNITIVPIAAAARSATVDPTVDVTGDLFLTPAAAWARAQTIDPTVIGGGVPVGLLTATAVVRSGLAATAVVTDKLTATAVVTTT